LEYQIEKLLRAGQAPAADATGEETGKEDALSFRPNPDMLVSKLDQMAEVEYQHLKVHSYWSAQSQICVYCF